MRQSKDREHDPEKLQTFRIRSCVKAKRQRAPAVTQPRILIGMPAFRAASMIREALHSISNQDYPDFSVLISVDGADSETAAACAPFLADSRFSLVVQDRRLGWAGNINWLMSQPDYDCFCYWQHDDYTSPNYISELLRRSTTQPSAVCYFSGIQWIGLMTSWMVIPSVTGLAINRSLSIFETLNGVPFRGLIRKGAIDRVGPICLTDFDSAFEEFVWVAKLAREGNLQYVEGPVYFKRAYEESTHAKWHRKDRLWRRAVWLEFGLGMLEVIWPLISAAERVTALGIVLDRLCIPKEGRFLFYDGPPIPFASDFVRKARKQFPIPSLEKVRSDMQARSSFAGEIAGQLLDRAIDWSLRGSANAVDEQSPFQFRLGGTGIDLLMAGWSSAETWGTWSDRPVATLRLPVAARGGTWKANITFTTFGKEKSEVTINTTVQSSTQSTVAWSVRANQVVQKELRLESPFSDIILQFYLPSATSPFELGLSADRRLLGIGLISLELCHLA